MKSAAAAVHCIVFETKISAWVKCHTFILQIFAQAQLLILTETEKLCTGLLL